MKDFIKSIWEETTTPVKVIFLVIMIGTMVTAVVTDTFNMLANNCDVLTIVFAGICDAAATGIGVVVFGVAFGIFYIAVRESE